MGGAERKTLSLNARVLAVVAHRVKLRLRDVHQQTGEEVHRIKGGPFFVPERVEDPVDLVILVALPSLLFTAI